MAGSARCPLFRRNAIKSHAALSASSTRAPRSDYPDGSSVICTGRFCSKECAEKGCPVLIESTTCAQVRFCYDADSGSDVWELPSEMVLANCDFSKVTRVCDEAAASARRAATTSLRRTRTSARGSSQARRGATRDSARP